MLRRTSLLSSFTLWLVPLGILFAVCQILPVPGVIFMMFVPLFNLNEVFLYVLIGGFVLDCVLGPFPLAALIVPAMAIGGFAFGYKGLYDRDQAALHVAEAQLQDQNQATPYRLDPARQALVATDWRLMIDYDLPAIYEPSTTKAAVYFRYTLRPPEECRPLTESAQKAGYLIGSARDGRQFCLNSQMTSLPGSALQVRTTKLDEPKIKVGELTVQQSRLTLVSGDRTLASIITAKTGVLPAYPHPVAFCGPIDAPPEWRCIADYRREPVELRTVAGAENSFMGGLLDVPRRTPEQVAALEYKR